MACLILYREDQPDFLFIAEIGFKPFVPGFLSLALSVFPMFTVSQAIV